MTYLYQRSQLQRQIGAAATARPREMVILEPPQEDTPALGRALSDDAEPNWHFVLDPPTPGLDSPGRHPLVYAIFGLGAIWALGKVFNHLFPAQRNPSRVFTTSEARRVGKAIGINWRTSKFGVDQFRRGLAIELEHGLVDPRTDVSGDDLLVTGKIAWAHLNEMADYYTRLEGMEQRAEAGLPPAPVRNTPASPQFWRFGTHPSFPGNNVYGIFLPKTNEFIGGVVMTGSGWSAHTDGGALIGGGFDTPARAAWIVYGTHINETERTTKPGFAANPIGHRWGGYYPFDEGMSLQYLLCRWVHGHDKLWSDRDIKTLPSGAYYHGLVPWQDLWQHRHIGRPLDKRLLEDVSEHGFKNPVHVYLGENGNIMVGEGAHRVVVAKELDVPLPVMFHFRTAVEKAKPEKLSPKYTDGWKP